jgi:hypothetical protein
MALGRGLTSATLAVWRDYAAICETFAFEE